MKYVQPALISDVGMLGNGGIICGSQSEMLFWPGPQHSVFSLEILASVSNSLSFHYITTVAMEIIV